MGFLNGHANCWFIYGWVGHVQPKNYRRPGWHKGVCVNSLPSFGDAFYTKSTSRPRQVLGQFLNRLEVIYKNVSDWFYKYRV
jgi:hypothetical protein